MEYQIRENPEQKKGVISNGHGFISTYLDGGFKEKWSGYWSPSHKYLDYYALKINGRWLTGENLEETLYGDKIVYRHSMPSLDVRHEIRTPENHPGFKLILKVRNRSEERKAVKASLEPGIDIRPKHRDILEEEYSIDVNNAGIKASRRGKYLSITGENLKFNEGSHIKTHFPGEKQKCLIPGEIFCQCEMDPGEKEEVKIAFRTDGEKINGASEATGSLKHQGLGRTFNYSQESLENLFYSKNGSGVIAGHPWFQNYWARDSFWTALGMIDAGMFEEAERALKNFADRESFPSKIHTDGGVETDYPRSDSIPLFAIAVDRLRKYYRGEKELVKRVEELLAEERPRGKIVDHDPDGTWMDTLKRGKAVDIQSLWIEALERYGKGTKRLRKGLEEFNGADYMRDNLDSDFESINPAVPLMFGHLDEEKAEKYLEKINGEFSSRYGARTRSVTDPGYDASGYHTGSVWGLTTCWAAAANLNYGKKDHGKNFLRKMTQFTDRNQLGALPEIVNAESGENIGCDEQAWSAGLFVHVVDSYLIGIEVEEGKVAVDPVEGISAERKGKKILGETIDLKVKNGEAEVTNSPDLEIEVK